MGITTLLTASRRSEFSRSRSLPLPFSSARISYSESVTTVVTHTRTHRGRISASSARRCCYNLRLCRFIYTREEIASAITGQPAFEKSKKPRVFVRPANDVVVVVATEVDGRRRRVKRSDPLRAGSLK